MSKPLLWTRDFINIWLSNFLLFTTFYALIAILPSFVTEVIHGTKQQIGLVMTCFVIAAILFRPVAGKLLDDLGRKKLLIVSLGLFLVASSMYVWIQSLSLLLALRFFHGISFGIGTTATGTIATDVVPDGRKGEGIGYYALSLNIAMVLGPFMGLTIASHVSFNTLFWILSGFSLLSFLFGIGTRTKEMVKNKKEKQKLGWKNFIQPSAIPISLVGMALSFAYSSILTFIPIFAKEIGVESAASYFYVFYAAAMVLSRPFTGRIFDRFGSNVIIYPCIFLYLIGLICLGASTSIFSFLVSGVVIGLGYGTIFPSLQTIAVMESPVTQRGLATSTFLMFFDAGIGIGATVLAMIAAATNYRMMYFISSAIVFFAIFIYYGLYHRRKKKLFVERVALLSKEG